MLVAKGTAVSIVRSPLLGDETAGVNSLLLSSRNKGEGGFPIFPFEVTSSTGDNVFASTVTTAVFLLSSSTDKLPFDESRIGLFVSITGEIGSGGCNATTGGVFGPLSTLRDSFVFTVDFSFLVTLGETFACCWLDGGDDELLRGGVLSPSSFVDFGGFEAEDFFLSSLTFLFGGRIGEEEDVFDFLVRELGVRLGGMVSLMILNEIADDLK